MGGFLDWRARADAQAVVEEWRGGSPKSNVQSPMSETESPTSNVHPPSSDCGATSGPMSSECGMSGKVAEALTERLMVHYAAALEDAIGGTDEKARKQVERLGRSLQDVVRIRRFELSRERAREWSEMEKEWMALERERIELQKARLTSPKSNVQGPKSANGPQSTGRSHEEKAEMVRQMVRDAREKLQEYKLHPPSSDFGATGASKIQDPSACVQLRRDEEKLQNPSSNQENEPSP